MKDEQLSGALQENVLTLLCFDDAHCKLIRAAVTPQLFESAVFREVAGHAINFIDQYGEAIKDHLPDHLEHLLKGGEKREEQRKADSYKRLLENLFLAREAVNSEYVIASLQKFVRQQQLKSAIVKAVEALDAGKVDEAEVSIQKALNAQVVSFTSGLNLSDPAQLLKVFEQPEPEGFTLGIPCFDNRGIIPRRKELMGFVAPRKRGKSWACAHIFKRAILQRWKPCLITLEMSEERYAVRILQSFLSVSRRTAEQRIATFIKDKKGDLQDIVFETINRHNLASAEGQAKAISEAKRRMKNRAPSRIKGFPTKSLDMAGLRAYLDGLERFENFVPDVLIVDYPDLMKHDAKNKRIELGEIFEQIRGLIGERNMAGFVVTQGNSEAERATTVRSDMVAEDISKLATFDNCLTYSRTPDEYKLGLARLLADAVRNEAGGITALISQNYDLGQFCLDSVEMHDTEDYWGMVAGRKRDDKDDEGDDGPVDRSDERRARRKR